MPGYNLKFKKYSSKLFEKKISDQVRQKSELKDLINVTQEYMETHNAVVTRLWEIRHNIELHRVELANNPNHLNNLELSKLKVDLINLEKLAQTFLNHLNENNSAKIIKENLKNIEQLHNKLYPKNQFHCNSPINLKTLKLK